MITILNPSEFEAGVKAYLENRFALSELTVPVPKAEASAVDETPAVIQGLSTDLPEDSPITVAIRANHDNPECEGWYAMKTLITVVTPLLNPEITLAHHNAVYQEIASSFPKRPSASADQQDKTDWAQYHAALDGFLFAESGYNASGWSAAPSIYSKSRDRVEQPIIVTIGAIHPEA